jgi:hypothetical protein
MIESTVKNTNNNPKILSFPLLAEKLDSKCKFIVLFYTETKGMVVFSNDSSCRKIGDYSDGWISCFKCNIWTILPKDTIVELKQL